MFPPVPQVINNLKKLHKRSNRERGRITKITMVVVTMRKLLKFINLIDLNLFLIWKYNYQQNNYLKNFIQIFNHNTKFLSDWSLFFSKGKKWNSVSLSFLVFWNYLEISFKIFTWEVFEKDNFPTILHLAKLSSVNLVHILCSERCWVTTVGDNYQLCHRDN